MAVAFADAEPKADADADAYYGGYGHLIYSGLGYAGFGNGYGGGAYGYPDASSYGSPYFYSRYRHGFGKRSVEAEAEPKADAHYGSYGYSNLGYARRGASGYAAPSAYSYGSYASPYYGGYGHGIGKRSSDADAEPEADAHYAAYGYNSAAAPVAYSAYSTPVSHHAVAAPVASYSAHVAAPVAAYSAGYGVASPVAYSSRYS